MAKKWWMEAKCGMKPFVDSINKNVPSLALMNGEKLAESPWRHDPPPRFRMNEECNSITRKFKICVKNTESLASFFDEAKVVEGYFTISYYADGYPGRILIYVGKQGEETHGWVNSLAQTISLLLQYGIRPEVIYEKLMFDEYEPKGITNTREAPICKSIIDLVMKYMRANFPPTAVEDHNSDYSEILTAVVERDA